MSCSREIEFELQNTRNVNTYYKYRSLGQNILTYMLKPFIYFFWFKSNSRVGLSHSAVFACFANYETFPITEGKPDLHLQL